MSDRTCRNHPDRTATHTAAMPASTKPYRENVPLCGDCAPRIETIGFPITEVEHHEQGGVT